MDKLTIGYITTIRSKVDKLQSDNPNYNFVFLNTVDHLLGVRFNIILLGYNCNLVDPDLLAHYKSRIV